MWAGSVKRVFESCGINTVYFARPSKLANSIMVEEQEFDLLVLDMMLPPDKNLGLDDTASGYETGIVLSKYLREQGFNKPIILISNVALEAWIDRIREALEQIDNIVFMTKHEVHAFRLSEYVERILSDGIGNLELDKKPGFLRRLFGRVILQPNFYGIGFDFRKKQDDA